MKAKLTVPCKKLFHQFKLKDRTVILCAKETSVNIQIGMSICNPLDKFDEKLGKHIAERKAVHPKRKLHISQYYVPHKELFTFGLFQYLLKQKEELIKLNPHKYIPAIKE